MASLEVVVTRLAATVLGAVAKSLLAPRPGAGLVRDPVRPLPRPPGPDRLAKVLSGRVLEAYGSLPEHERLAAVDSVRDTFAAAGEIDAARLFAADLDPERLRGRLRAPAAGLGARSLDLYDELLALCCAHLVEQFTAHPSFAARAAVEQTRTAARTQDVVEDLRTRAGPRPATAALDFEARYTKFVEETQSRLELFGLTLGRSAGEWPLDTAYISLTVSGDRSASREGFELSPAVGRVSVTAEQALAEARWVVLRGPAGSGKTTLVQWLALNAARRGFPDALAEWNQCVPFVLRLRAFTRSDELPQPADFLRAAGVPLSGEAPPGWTESLLRSGRALVLVDGVDEVPTRLRSRTERWLKWLVTAYPDARYVVTTRPSAVPEDWMTGQGFTAHALLPMERDDIRAFVAHWHEAAREESPGDSEVLDTYEASLVQSVTNRRDLGRLATNPLMCALLCALNRDRRTRLPRARKELYDAALDLLLVRRDTEREVLAVEGVDLTRDEQTALLQQLAYWLIRNGQAQAARSETEERVGRWLDSMPQVQGTAGQVFQHLLIRSGLLREPVPGTVDFVHRTFQDYLGAKAAVEERDFGVLIRNAHDDQWDDVVRMAVGHARADERVILLRGLLRRADGEAPHRNRLMLLAAASLEHAPVLDPAVRGEIERRTGELIPPRGLAEAEELAKAGQLVLELVPGPEGLDEDSAAAVVRVAALVGGDAALEVVSRFREDGRPAVSIQLSHAWGRFETERYARTVLASSTWSDTYLQVRTEEQLRALRVLPETACVSLIGPFSDLSGLRALHSVSSVFCTNNAVLRDLSPLTRLPSLRMLGLLDCPELRNLSPLLDTGIDTLYLYGMPPDLVTEPLRRMESLESVLFDYPVPARSVGELPLGPRLTELQLYSRADQLKLDGLGSWPALRRLTVSGDRQAGELSGRADPLPLEFLRLHGQKALFLDWIGDWHALTTVALAHSRLAGSLAPLADLPHLRSVLLADCVQGAGPVDLSPLAHLEHLTVFVAQGTRVRDEDAFPPGRLVRE
ncbi:NACHT domain-containing protein [Streptomyces sp. NPDC087420]|uniref:NACHT domain-containing protein n=1 Tax=Streptomyces sp. NPDC087420 TaxID=3365785 RepID=UPI0038380EAE